MQGVNVTVTLTRLFDPHIHMDSRTTDDYDEMSKAGIEVIVQPSFSLGSPRTSVGTFEDYWEHMITFETKRAMLMTVSLPHNNKPEGMKRIERILNGDKSGNKYNRKKILVVVHNVEETIEKSLELDMWAGLSVYPITKLSLERAMKIIKKYGTERIMIHSAADWGISDPLSVPLMAREMRREGGFSISDIERVTFYNAYEYFKHSSRFTRKP